METFGFQYFAIWQGLSARHNLTGMRDLGGQADLPTISRSEIVVVIKNNIIEKNEFYGILQLWCNQVDIEGNTFLNHSNVALQLYSSKENNIIDNIVEDNNKGISLDASSFNFLSDNNVSRNQYAIYLWYKSNNNHIEKNMIYFNFYGVYLGHSEYNNIFIWNNITNNP